jgi:hypothetical protein
MSHKSLMKILKNRGHKVEPCGTPDSMGIGEEEFPEVRTTEALDDK